MISNTLFKENDNIIQLLSIVDLIVPT